MPEPQETEEEEVKPKSTKNILDFFKPIVKESKKDKNKPLTKIVVRRLPPKLTKEDFLSEFILPPHDYFYFVRGNLALGVHSFSRAYFNCLNIDDTYGFKEKYDDHTITDEFGKEYHAVVEWAPVQRVPIKSMHKKKLPKSGTLETDARYVEFLEKLEQEKNNPTNSSEYFLETENLLVKDAKVTTTPLLEYIKMKRQKKIDIRNENRLKKREAEKERRRKEDEARKSDKQRKSKDEKETRSSKRDVKEEGKSLLDSKEESDIKAKKSDSEDDERDKKVYVRSEKVEKPDGRQKAVYVKSFGESKGKVSKESLPETKPKSSEEKVKATSHVSKKPDNIETRVVESSKVTGAKSKFRYSEQRNRDREVRSQKLDTKNETCEDSGKSDAKKDTSEDVRKIDTKKERSEDGRKLDTKKERSQDSRKTDAKKERNEDSRKPDTKKEKLEDGRIRDAKKEKRESSGPEVKDENKETVKREPLKSQPSLDGSEGSNDDAIGRDKEHVAEERERPERSRKDPRTERRIRNKDRPSMEIYRPGMGKFSKQRLEQKKDDSETEKTSSTPEFDREGSVEKVDGQFKTLKVSDADENKYYAMVK